MSDPTILHAAEADHWAEALVSGEYRWSTLGRTLEDVGFIHCSTPAQLPGVLAGFYASYPGDLVVLTIEVDRLTAPVRWDVVDSVTGERFPHIYGPLNLDAVTLTQVLHPPHGAPLP